MDAFELIKLNLLSPMVLCFALGGIARFLKSDLSLPESVYTALSAYLLLAIGMKGGVALAEAGFVAIILPTIGTLILGVIIPFIVFHVTRRGGINIADAAALAAHYGSVSAVTFIAALTFLQMANEPFEGFMPALVAILEIPAIIVGLLLARSVMGEGRPTGEVVHEIITGKSVVLLAGGMFVGILTGPVGFAKVEDFFVRPFQGLLCLFLLDMGLLAAARLKELRKAGLFLAAFAIIMPLFNGTLGVLTGWLVGLSIGGSMILGTMAASASYIAAPAAVRMALPKANPSYYLTTSIGITFPFNLAVGIPIYYAMAKFIFASATGSPNP